jgi:hypothetical protein
MIAQAAEHDEEAERDETVVYVNVKGVRVSVSLIGGDVHRLKTLLMDLLDDWELQSVTVSFQKAHH